MSIHPANPRPQIPTSRSTDHSPLPGSLAQPTHWIIPTLSIAAIGIGIYSIYLGVVNYLADAYVKYAASALSAAGLGRNLFGAFLPLASPALFADLGYGWASTVLGFVAALLSVAPVVLLWKGPGIRKRSPFMNEAGFDGLGVEKDEVGEGGRRASPAEP